MKVTLSDEQAEQLQLDQGGSFVFTSDAPTDLVVGEEAIVFLDYEAIDGLYDGRYGYRFELFPAHELYYKYRVEGEQALNARDSRFDRSLAELRLLILANPGTKVGPKPTPGTFPAQPHPPSSGGSPPDEKDEPPHEHGEGS